MNTILFFIRPVNDYIIDKILQIIGLKSFVTVDYEKYFFVCSILQFYPWLEADNLLFSSTFC